MADWDNGYVTDSSYVCKFTRNATPPWLALTALLGGQPAPDLRRPFCYVDLGCGNGLTALVTAAANPHAEVWGVDFNPAHVEFAAGLAERAGLRNAQFREASFADLARPGGTALPPADMVVAHGVVSWISEGTQAELVQAVNRLLRPGGLAYVSYNLPTARANMVPLRTLMRLLAGAAAEPSDQAMPGVLAQMERLRAAGAAYFQLNPALEQWWQSLGAQDPRYLAHEYLNRNWRPMMFDDVSAAMRDAKCSFLASATLADNVMATSVPPGVAEMLTGTAGQALRETMSDIAAARPFRRDVFRRGVLPTTAAQSQAGFERMSFGATYAAKDGPVSFDTNFGSVTANDALYEPLLTRLRAGPASLGVLAALPEFGAVSHGELMQALVLLTEAGHVHPLLPGAGAEAHAATMRLNRAIAEMNTNGAGLGCVAVPTMGTALSCDVLDSLVVGALLDGAPAEAEAIGRAVRGRLPPGGLAQAPILNEEVAARLQRLVDPLTALGVLGAAPEPQRQAA